MATPLQSPPPIASTTPSIAPTMPPAAPPAGVVPAGAVPAAVPSGAPPSFDLGSRKRAFQEALKDPKVAAALLQFATSALQPPVARGMPPLAQIGAAVQEGGEAAGRVAAQEREQAATAHSQQALDEANRLRELGIKTEAATRLTVVETQAKAAKDRLVTQIMATEDLSEAQIRATAVAAAQRFVYDGVIRQDEHADMVERLILQINSDERIAKERATTAKLGYDSNEKIARRDNETQLAGIHADILARNQIAENSERGKLLRSIFDIEIARLGNEFFDTMPTAAQFVSKLVNTYNSVKAAYGGEDWAKLIDPSVKNRKDEEERYLDIYQRMKAATRVGAETWAKQQGITLEEAKEYIKKATDQLAAMTPAQIEYWEARRREIGGEEPTETSDSITPETPETPDSTTPAAEDPITPETPDDPKVIARLMKVTHDVDIATPTGENPQGWDALEGIYFVKDITPAYWDIILSNQVLIQAVTKKFGRAAVEQAIPAFEAREEAKELDRLRRTTDVPSAQALGALD